MYDSHHSVDFTISGGLPSQQPEQILLRRRKMMRWNRGARYALLKEKPTPDFVSKVKKEIGCSHLPIFFSHPASSR